MHCKWHGIEQHVRACRRPLDSDLPDDGEDLPLRISRFGEAEFPVSGSKITFSGPDFGFQATPRSTEA